MASILTVDVLKWQVLLCCPQDTAQSRKVHRWSPTHSKTRQGKAAGLHRTAPSNPTLPTALPEPVGGACLQGGGHLGSPLGFHFLWPMAQLPKN